ERQSVYGGSDAAETREQTRPEVHLHRFCTDADCEQEQVKTVRRSAALGDTRRGCPPPSTITRRAELPDLPYSSRRNQQALAGPILPCRAHSLPVLRYAQCASHSTPPNVDRRYARRTSLLARAAGSVPLRSSGKRQASV